MEYKLVATHKKTNTVRTKDVDAADDSVAVALARTWKNELPDAFHQHVQVALPLLDGAIGNVVGTVD